MKKFIISLLTFILLLCSFGLVACREPETDCKHENTQKSTTVEATCTQTGLEKTTCKDCGKVLSEKTLSKLSHTSSDWIIDTNATCEEEGSKYKECTVCEKVMETETIEKTWHNFVNGECEYCGDNEANYITEGLEFTLINDDTEYSVTGYTGISAEVYIPGTYQGKLVTSIGGAAFGDCDSLTSIEIPSSVTSIGEWAFSGCDNLQYNIEGNLKYLGNNENKYLYLAGTTSDDITSATINPNCRFIGYNAFVNCSSLTSVDIPNSVTSIGQHAFDYCYSLTSIVIPNSVTSIGDWAFDNCSSLTSIVIPRSVTSIGGRAFFYCTSLTSIVIPNSVTSIGNYAISYCSSLTIYCEATEKPSGWASTWNYDNRPVEWGYDGNN